MEGSEMIIGIICIGTLVGFVSAGVALVAGYSLLMALGFYTLFGCLAALLVGTISVAARVMLGTLGPQEAQTRLQ
jgi:hypothetical protein